jgi:hypothetical protein
MRKLSLTRCAMLLALAAATASAADVTGTWTAQMSGPDGGGSTITFHFKQDGAKLTGTVDGPQGEPMQISEGKVEGDKISFAIRMDRDGGEGMKMLHDGAINGDEIKLNTKMEGGPDGGRSGPPPDAGRGGPPPDGGGRGAPPDGGRGGPGGQMTLKRSK